MVTRRWAPVAAMGALALLLAGCTPPQDHMVFVLTSTVDQGAPVGTSLGHELGPDMRELEHLELVSAPLVDEGPRAWDAMPSNMAAGRPLSGTVSAHALVTGPLDLPPGDYALWFRWGEHGEDHSDGYGLLSIRPHR